MQVLLQRVACSLFMGIAIVWLAREARATDFSEEFKTNSKAHSAKANEIAAELQSLPANQQDENKQVLYLVESTWAVYEAVEAYMMKYRQLPADLESLVSQGFLQEWPKNPFNGWAPQEVRDEGSPFSAGAIIWSLCPPEFYSEVHFRGRKFHGPLSYQLTVLGPVVDHPYSTQISAMEGNSWFTAPAGALMTIGSFTETAAQSEAKRREAAKTETQSTQVEAK